MEKVDNIKPNASKAHGEDGSSPISNSPERSPSEKPPIETSSDKKASLEKPEASFMEDVEKTDHEIHVLRRYTEDEYNRVIRKLDWNIMPMILVLYSLSVLDRSNLGNARLAGLEDDVNLGGDRYEWLGTIFYIAYILSQWTQIGWKAFRPHIWIASAVFLWGVISTLQATATGWGALMVCRVGLGIAEAMYGPGVPLYLSYFYPRERLGLRTGIFLSGSALANAYGGALAYGISQAKSSVAAPWQILFIVEGVPTCLLAIVAFFTMPDSPASARFLTAKEKEIAIDLSLRQPGDRDTQGLQVKQLLGALLDWRCYPPGLMYFGCNVCFGSLPLFLPTIISELGSFTKIQSQGLTSPPYLLCFFTIILVSFVSDRVKVRGPFVSFFGGLAAVGFLILANATGVGVRYFAMFLAVTIFVSVACILIWVSNTHATDSKRAGALAICATMGQCGPVLGTNVFPNEDKPFFRKGMWVSAGACLLVMVVAAFQSTMLWRENKRRDRIYGKSRDEKHTRVTDPMGKDEYFSLLPSSTGLLAQLTNPRNITLLASQLLCEPALWSGDLNLTFCRRIFSVFYTAAVEVARRAQDSSPTTAYGGPKKLSPDDWAKAAVQGADERSPRYRHVILIGSALLGFEGQDKRILSTQVRRRLETALVTAANLALENEVSADQGGVCSTTFVLNNTFHLLSDLERGRMQYNHLLPALINLTFFSGEGLQNCYFLGASDKDILEVSGNKFGWHSNTPSFRLVDQLPMKPLLSSFGPLSRLIAHAIENVKDPSLVLAALEDLHVFSKATIVQWRQNKISEIDESEESQFLDEATVSQTLPKLWRVLRMVLFAHVIILRAISGRLLGDPFLSSGTNAPRITTTILHILRNLYFISSRLGEVSSSQYMFVSLSAIDVLAQYPADARTFITAIRPHVISQIPAHPLDRCLDLFYLNIGEHLTPVLSPELNDELLIAAASPYLVAEGSNNLLDLFEAAHSVVLAVFATPKCTELAAKHIPFYVDALFSAFPHNLSVRQFRLAFKTLVRITATPSSFSATQSLLPSILLEMVHERVSRASQEPLRQPSNAVTGLDNSNGPPLSEQAVLIISIADSLCYLPIPLLQEWLPIAADILQRIPDEGMRRICLDRFWEAISSGEMDVERAALCVAWWTTLGGRDRTLFGDGPAGEEKQYLMSGGLGLDGKL